MASNPTRPSRVSVEIPPTVLAAPFVPMADFMNEVLRRSEVGVYSKQNSIMETLKNE